MALQWEEGQFRTYSCIVETVEPVRYQRYFFEQAVGEDTVFFGAEGPSATPPARAFEYLYTNELDVFEIPDWARGVVAYQIFPERFQNGDTSNDPKDVQDWGGIPTRENFFGGDLKGILAKLDYLVDLDVELLYLNPLFRAPSNHKYDTEDYYAIDPAFGSTEDLKELVSQCHARGIRVVLDMVFNHCGYRFAPFQDLLEKGAESRYADWFLVDGFPVRTDPPNYECVGYYKWMPKLRLKNREVRDYFLDVGRFWIREADIDGWRIDVADEVDFTFLQEFRRAVKELKPDALLLGETWKDGRDLLRGDQMDSVMDYLFRDALVAYFAERSIDARTFDQRTQRILANYPDNAHPVLYNLIGSHDTARFLTVAGGDLDRLKLAVVFQMTFPGIPAIYYGDELGMKGENDPGCRGPMDWRNGDLDLLAFYRRLTALRKSSRALRHGTYQGFALDKDVHGHVRRSGRETVYVLINPSEEERNVRLPVFDGRPLRSLLDGKKHRVLLQEGMEKATETDPRTIAGRVELELPARHFDIFEQGGEQE